MHKTIYVNHTTMCAAGSPDCMDIEIPKSFTAPQLRAIAAALTEAADKLEPKACFKVGDLVRSKLIDFVGHITRIRCTKALVESSYGNYCTAELKDLEPAPAPRFNVGDRVQREGVLATVIGFTEAGWDVRLSSDGRVQWWKPSEIEPAPEPAPKFNVGDRVRLIGNCIVGEVSLIDDFNNWISVRYGDFVGRYRPHDLEPASEPAPDTDAGPEAEFTDFATWDEMVETAARAMCDDNVNWENGLCGVRKTAWKHRASKALTALRDAGVRFMPAEATEEMLDVMHDRVRILVVPSERRADIQNDAEVYTAMLEAGEIKPGEGHE